MLIRALIVLLLVLNLGVAAWWHWSTPVTAMTDVAVPPNVARLQLVRERDGAATGSDTVTKPATGAATGVNAPAPAAVAASMSTAAPLTTEVAAPSTTPPATGVPPGAAAAADTTPADAMRCYSFGPFDSEDALLAAQATLKPLTQSLRVRRVAPRAGRGWRVYLPPVANATEASAIAGRISAAGFRDYFIVREGAEAHSVALGRYATESAARRHADALNAAGFPARAEPLGEGTGAAWVDVRAAAGFDAAGVRAQVGAGQLRPADCTTLR
jgi:hypothetical protein